MMKLTFNFAIIFLFLSSCAADAQTGNTDSLYVNYGSYISALEGFIRTGSKESWRKSTQAIRESVGSMPDENPVSYVMRPAKGRKKMLTDEEIYAKRSGSVFMIGKLRKGDRDNILFDMIGTAFAISGDGICVTNLHVLQNTILSKEQNNDLVYFVISQDKKVYIFEKMLSYSRNNDLAVFKIDTKGDRLNRIPLGDPARVGSAVFCISNPAGQLFYFTKGMVARNVMTDSVSVSTSYNRNGKPPIRMEISAEYGGGSSGGPVLDKFGELVGIISSTNTISLKQQQSDGTIASDPQMVIRNTIPVLALRGLIQE